MVLLISPLCYPGQFQGRCPGFIFFIEGNLLFSVEIKYDYEIKLIYVVQKGQGE